MHRGLADLISINDSRPRSRYAPVMTTSAPPNTSLTARERKDLEVRLRCPLDLKPVCKHCPVPCYRPGYREQAREIMRFSGKYLMRRGRLDLLRHYFF